MDDEWYKSLYKGVWEGNFDTEDFKLLKENKSAL